MSLQSIIDLVKDDWGSWLVVFVVVTSIVQITPIKINPWTIIMDFIGRRINKDTICRLESLEKKMDEHINETESSNIKSTRISILDFANSCMNGRKHTQEEFEFIIGLCDKYTKYCKDNDIENGVADESIKEIKRIYSECRKNKSFLKAGGVDNEC